MAAGARVPRAAAPSETRATVAWSRKIESPPSGRRSPTSNSTLLLPISITAFIDPPRAVWHFAKGGRFASGRALASLARSLGRQAVRQGYVAPQGGLKVVPSIGFVVCLARVLCVRSLVACSG